MNTASADLLTRLARPEVRELPAYNAGLSSEVVRQRYGVTHVARLASNENPFGPSPAVANALAGLAASASIYPDANCHALRAAIAGRTGAQAGEVVIGNGSENLLEVLCQAFLSPGDRVVTLVPSFGLHDIYPRMMGARADGAGDASAGVRCGRMVRGAHQRPAGAQAGNAEQPVQPGGLHARCAGVSPPRAGRRMRRCW